ncbi:MAG: glycosyltransferase family 9 protein [Candidatus Omnitrophica bacterium]|nr:glycosyltransferase family 9 protein [Candidatus Omnitrophota bacterium]
MDHKNVTLSDIFHSLGSWQIKLIKVADLLCGTVIALFLPAIPTSLRPGKISRILIIRPGGIGDAVFLLPFLRRLKDLGFLVDIVAERRNKDVFLSQQNLVGQVFCYDQGNDVREVFRRRYDAVIDTEQWHYFSAIFSYFIKARFKSGFSARPLRSKLFSIPVSYDQGYEIDNFRRLFEAVVCTTSFEKIEMSGSFNVFEPLLSWAHQEVKSFQSVVLSLGVSTPQRRLTSEQICKIALYLKSKGYTIFIVGGADVACLSDQITHVLGTGVINFAGRLDLAHSSALIAAAGFFIGADSGLLHIASALGVRTVGIFGPANTKKWAPRGKNDKVVSLALPCSPCMRYSYFLPTCGQKFSCLRDIKLEDLCLPD